MKQAELNELLGQIDRGLPRNNWIHMRESKVILKVPTSTVFKNHTQEVDETLPYFKVWIAAELYNLTGGGDHYARAKVTFSRKKQPALVSYPLELTNAGGTISNLWSAFVRGTGSPSRDMLMLTDVEFSTSGLVPKSTLAVADSVNVEIVETFGCDGLRFIMAIEQTNYRW